MNIKKRADRFILSINRKIGMPASENTRLDWLDYLRIAAGLLLLVLLAVLFFL